MLKLPHPSHPGTPSLSRRCFVRAGAALGAAALVAPLTGCDVLDLLGIEDPNANVVQEEAATPGTADFSGLLITLNLDESSWSWSQLNNTSRAENGSLVVGIPMTATNNDDQNRVISGIYCKVSAPDGVVQSDISSYFASTDILQVGGIAAGTSETGLIHIVFRGAGTYTLLFDNLLGEKVELPVTISNVSNTSGLRPIPSELSVADATGAIPYGNAFDVSGLTLTFSANEDIYTWEQSWDSANAAWDGRWCVGVPLTITNYSNVPLQLSLDMYGLYAPWYYKQGDPAPWFSTRSAGYVGLIAAGSTVETMLWWPYDGDGWYYAAFDNYGAKTVASVRIAQYS